MEARKKALVSGASFAGLSTAYWMNRLGYDVTVVEIGPTLKKGGTPADIQGDTVSVVTQMGLFEHIQAHRISMENVEFKDADDVTVGSGFPPEIEDEDHGEQYEIERDELLHALFKTVKDDVEFLFGETITSIEETETGVDVQFKTGLSRTYDLVFGCDGIHSTVRRLCFGPESEFSSFMRAYFSITIVNKLLIRENTTQIYREAGKMIMLNAYNGKTDIVLCFQAETEIPYDYRNEEQQRKIVLDQFAGLGWRTSELIGEVESSETFYFDKFCQMKMPSWTKGRVALVGDAGYCVSPAAGRGGSIAIDGAAALAQAFERCDGNFARAFKEYNASFRPFIEKVQSDAVNFGLKMLLPSTE